MVDFNGIGDLNAIKGVNNVKGTSSANIGKTEAKLGTANSQTDCIAERITTKMQAA